MDIKVEPIKPLLGAVVRCDKATMFEPGFAEKIKEVLRDRGALVFPQLNFTDQEQLAFTDTLGDRLNFIYKDMVPEEDLVPMLVTLLVYFKQDRQESETFGDFCHRKWLEDLLAWSERFLPTAKPNEEATV